MADATLRGAFELSSEQALRQLGAIRDRGREADAALESVGRRLDELSVRRVAPRVELAGFDRVNAQLAELELRLDRIGSKRVSSRVALSSGGGGGLISTAAMTAASGGGGGGGSSPTVGRAFSTLGGVGGALPWWSAALPLAPGVIGGAGALVGSAGAAALGAGTVGLGALGPLAAGGALTAVIAKPAISGLQEVTKAQTAYNNALQEFGRHSTQAATAARNLNLAVTQNPMAVGAARQITATRNAWDAATAPARANVYRGIAAVAYNARAAIPAVSADATLATGAVATSADRFSRFLAGPQEQAVLTHLTGAFAQNLPVAERSLENIATIFSHLAVDAVPFFHEANLWVENWTAGMARSSSDQARVTGTMQGLVTSAKDWARLTGATARTLKDLFAPSAQPGNSMVVDLTNSMDRWDGWIRRNPDKVRQFFRDGEQSLSRIATIVGNLAHDVWSILQAISPLLSRAEQFIGFASGLGGGSLLAGGGLLYGAYQGARGALGGGGPSPGALVRSFVGGSAGPLIVSTGGRAGGGTVVGGSAPASMVGRASRFEVATGRTAGGAFLMGGATVGTQAVLERRAAAQAAAEAGRMERLSAPLSSMIADSPRLARIADVAASATNVAAGALGGAARFLGPLLALNGVIGALGARGSLQQRAGAGISQATLGLVSPQAGAHLAPGLAAGGAGLALSRAAPSLLARLASPLIAPNTAEALLGGTLGGVLLGGAGAYAGFMVSPDATGASLGNRKTQLSLHSIASDAGAVRTPDQLRALQARVASVRLNAELAPNEARKLEAFMQNALSVAATNAGAASSNSWEDAFTRGIDKGTKPEKAVTQMLSGMQSQVGQLGPRGAMTFARDTAMWASQLAASNPQMQRPMQRLMTGIVDDINRMNHDTGQSFKELQSKVFYFNGQILQGSKSTWQQIGKALTDPAQVAQEKLAGTWATIQAQAIDALSSMGFSRAQARDIVTQSARGGGFAAGAAAQVQTKVATGQTLSPGAAYSPHARGGVIQGAGLLDTVQLPGGAGTAAPGEAWIANRHTMNDLSRATLAKFGKTAWQMIRDEDRPHSAPPMGGRHAFGGRMFSTGGLTMNANSAAPTPAGGSSSTSGYVYGYSRVEPMGRTDQGLDFTGAGPIFAIGAGTVTESGLWPGWPGSGGNVYRLDTGPYAGQYVYNMEHVRSRVSVGQHVNAGQYIGDVLPGYPWLETGWANSSSTGPLTPYNGARDGTPMGGGSQFRSLMMALKSGGQLPAGVGGAFGGGGVGRSVSLRAPRSGLAGIPGAMADQASRLYAAGLQRKINASIGGGGGISAAGFTGGGNSAANQQLGQRMMLAAGWGMDQWPALQALWTQESGWDANSVNSSSGAYGIPQALGHGHPFNLGDAPAQIAWGLNYIRGRYGSPDAAEAHERSHNWYSRGGAVNWAGWNAKGGTFTTMGPTVFGAGEKGRETVTISPSSGGGRAIHIEMKNVTFYGGDREQLRAVAEVVAEEIIVALDGAASGTSDARLAGVA